MVKTKGIILNQIKYKETSIIVKIFTEELGIKSYIINSVRTKKPKYNPAIFQPLNVVDMVAYDKKTSSINYISELKLHCIFHNIIADPQKAFASIFVSELINKTIKEGETHENTFAFLFAQISNLNNPKTIDSNLFIIKFMLQFCHHLGFGIKNAQEMTRQLLKINRDLKFSSLEENFLNDLILTEDIQIPKDINTIEIIDKLLLYYRIHIPSIYYLKSFDILRIM